MGFIENITDGVGQLTVCGKPGTSSLEGDIQRIFFFLLLQVFKTGSL